MVRQIVARNIKQRLVDGLTIGLFEVIRVPVIWPAAASPTLTNRSVTVSISRRVAALAAAN